MPAPPSCVSISACWPSAVASTAVVAGLVTLPITPLIGMLSDHVGRRCLLVISYTLAAGGVILLSMITSLWHFWLVTALLFVATSTNGSVATALATDALPHHALRRGMSWLNSMTWVAGIIGFAGTGYLMDTLGAAATCLIAAMLAIAAAGLLGGARARSPRLQHSTGVGSFWRPSRRREEELLPDS